MRLTDLPTHLPALLSQPCRVCHSNSHAHLNLLTWLCSVRRQLRGGLGMFTLAVDAVFILQADFAIAPLGFSKLVSTVMAGKGSFCYVMLELEPWPAFLWCGGWSVAAYYLGCVGVMSFIAGQPLPLPACLLLIQHTALFAYRSQALHYMLSSMCTHGEATCCLSLSL